MIISRAFAWACLTLLGWALFFVAGLLLILIMVQYLRGDAHAQPLVHLAATAVAAGLGLLCRTVAQRLA